MTTHDIDIELPPLPKGMILEGMSVVFKDELVAYRDACINAAIEADRKRRGISNDCEPVGYVSPSAIKRLKAGGNVIVGGMMPGFDVPLYAAPQPSEPVKVNAIFETQGGEVIGTTDAKVKRVEWQDDGSLTVVIDYWPQPAEPVKVPSDTEIGQILKEVLHNSRYGAHQWELWLEFASALFTRCTTPQPAEPDSAKCAECGAEMIHIRPGKWQHPDCSQSP